MPPDKYLLMHEVADVAPLSEHVCASLSAHARQMFSVEGAGQDVSFKPRSKMLEEGTGERPTARCVVAPRSCRAFGYARLVVEESSGRAEHSIFTFVSVAKNTQAKPRSQSTYQRVGVTASEQAKKGLGQVAHDPLPRSNQPVTQRATHKLPSGLRTLPGWQIHADLFLLRENLDGIKPIGSAACI